MSGLLGYVVTAIISYFIGNLNFSIIFGKLFYKKDIREMGSGNAGSTNTFRNFGPWMGTLVLICDIGKGVLAVYLAKYVLFGTLNYNAAYLAGLFAAIGHIYPVIFKFKGGKGVATIAGMLVMIDWKMFLIGLVLFLGVLFITGYMSVASMSLTAIIPVCTFVFFYFVHDFSLPQTLLVTAYGLGFGGLIIFTHRSNIKRLKAGTESKLIKWGKKNG